MWSTGQKRHEKWARIPARSSQRRDAVTAGSVDGSDGDLRCLEGVKEIFHANGAVATHRIGHADVIVAQLDRIAGAASFAMEEVFAATDAADAALLAVELLLAQVIVVKIANTAEIISEAHTCKSTRNYQNDAALARWPGSALLRTTVCARGTWRLLFLACQAHDRLHIVPIHVVLQRKVLLAVRLDFVMAEAAREELAATRCTQLAATFVVLATSLNLSLSVRASRWRCVVCQQHSLESKSSAALFLSVKEVYTWPFTRHDSEATRPVGGQNSPAT